MKLLVIGISVLDQVHYMDTLPVGGTKHRSRNLVRIGGGCAANAAVGAARLGAEVVLMTRLGQDPAGDELAAMLEAAGVTLAVARGGRTPQSSVMVDASGERMIVNFPGADLPVTPPPLPAFDAVLADCRWPEAAEAGLRAAHGSGRPGILDGEKYTPDALAVLASHVVFSAPGLRDFTGVEDLNAALRMAGGCLPGLVAYTDGARGVRWHEGLHVPAPSIDAVDTLGAGDLWHGAFAMALGRGVELEAASDFANRASAIKCARAGGWEVYPTADDLKGT
ncbi:Ribokinase [Jannaschia seosinensis]|uniref:Ribokinase n=1 Tax=Jannaschia seosinensis TaxID=313367 RepID=A0A0M7BEY0_9RHOB|nr:PfkB family carbohydrate kinase [Jannaschia seosinensis]CUH39935.1 Ribokinase [Jannaschia seosinensis]